MLMSTEKRHWRYFGLCLATLALAFFLGDGPMAIAAEDGSAHSGGHGSSHVGGKGKRGGSGQGHSTGSHGSDHSGGHGSSHAGKGQRGGHSGNIDVTRERGQRPVWAQEGLPEAELGRLNAARAPNHVLTRALAEAHGTLAADPQASIHSPPQNLALYWEAMSKPETWTREQAAKFLGTAADKRIPITADTVRALNLILGVSESDPAGMAQAADGVRQQLLADHDLNSGSDGHEEH
jgi:hypothetical protein